MAGIRGLGTTGTALPRNMVYQSNQFDQTALQENGRNFALKLRFDNVVKTKEMSVPYESTKIKLRFSVDMIIC